jgi:hypothetical protein
MAAFDYLFDMVHFNPGEPPVRSAFRDPARLRAAGFNGMVINDFIFVSAVVPFDSPAGRLFPATPAERAWADRAAAGIERQIVRCHRAGIRALFFTDFIVLPKRVKDYYGEKICDAAGDIVLEKPATLLLLRAMLGAVFRRFPGLDGLVVRTGEVCLLDLPYHAGNLPITRGAQSHLALIRLLRAEVCAKHGKFLVYRTWSFDGFHTDPAYYRRVTARIPPHPKLLFSMKHTAGDYWRTYPFNPTLGIGRHRQLVEVQCQREYEGKGAYPAYVMHGVIHGFEEFAGRRRPQGLADLRGNRRLAGIWVWSRGGGWVGPHIVNEFWCKLNAGVLSRWARQPEKSEPEVFAEQMHAMGVAPESRAAFRKLCLLSAAGILRGHYYHQVKFPAPRTPPVFPHYIAGYILWTRDEFLGGLDLLQPLFAELARRGRLEAALAEKAEGARIWGEIARLAGRIRLRNRRDEEYLRVSCRYGQLLFAIIRDGWRILAEGFMAERVGWRRAERLRRVLRRYDRLWREYRRLKAAHACCATLYQPYSWTFTPPLFHQETGLQESVEQVRQRLARAKGRPGFVPPKKQLTGAET